MASRTIAHNLSSGQGRGGAARYRSSAKGERLIRIATVALIFLVLPVVVLADRAAPPRLVSAAKAAAAPVIDGMISDGEWDGATRLDLDHQTQPGDNSAPSERTEVFLSCDRENLYVAFHAFDSDPQSIRSRVARREDIFSDDYVTIYLDTYDDRRRAYVFYFNPLGIQADGIYTEGASTGRVWDKNIDFSWDGILASKGRVTDDGYVVEAAIPFKTMRFQSGKDRRWGLHFVRWIARRTEQISWQPISRDVSSFLSQMGSLTGLEEIYQGRTLDIIPTLTASSTGTRQPDGRLDNLNRIDPGLTVNFAITPNLTLSAAINPDFSQIEADVPQIEVNQRFPLFFAEKRPFFLEGSEVFRSIGALTFVNTRQIVDPDWGLKLTGKTGRNTLGLMSASDRAPGLVLSSDDEGAGDKAYFNIARYRRDILKDSSVGAFLTDRRFAGSSNTVVAADGQLLFGRINTIGFQAAYSRSRDGLNGSQAGGAAYVWYELRGRHWRIFLNELNISEHYASQTGFVRRAGFNSNSMNLGYEFQPKEKSWYVKIRPFLVAKYLRTSEGLVDESFFDPGVDLTLARGIALYVYHSFHKDGFTGREFPYQFNVVYYTVNTFKRVLFDGYVQFGEGVNFDPARAVIGKSFNSSFAMTIKPGRNLNTEFLHIKSNLEDKSTGHRLFNQDVLRNRTTYQFTRNNSFRSIFEYDTSARRAGVSLLYSFTPQPNTALFLGYNDLIFNGFDPLERERASGLFRLRRVFFVKASYNFRL